MPTSSSSQEDAMEHPSRMHDYLEENDTQEIQEELPFEEISAKEDETEEDVSEDEEEEEMSVRNMYSTYNQHQEENVSEDEEKEEKEEEMSLQNMCSTCNQLHQEMRKTLQKICRRERHGKGVVTKSFSVTVTLPTGKIFFLLIKENILFHSSKLFMDFYLQI